MIKLLKRIKNANLRGSIETPLFYFGAISVILFGLICVSSGTYASSVSLSDSRLVFLNSFLNKQDYNNRDSLFVARDDKIALETPDLKIAQDNTIFGISTTSIVSAKVLGDVFGGNTDRKDIIEYVVQPGDSFSSIAEANGVSVNTLLWANELTSSSKIKVGQSLIILPTDGVLHIVKSGDTIGAIAQKYETKSEDVIAFNDLANQDDIYIGDILIVPGGVMPKKSAPLYANQIPLADNYFIFPTQGYTGSLGLHYYNAIDLVNKCGTPIYAAAAGVVQRAVANGQYNQGMGNHITILHGNGTVTYYGHLMTVLVKSGDKVNVGQNIALMGGQPGMLGAGKSTGCHVHFQVQGATNPLAKYPKGTNISYK